MIQEHAKFKLFTKEFASEESVRAILGEIEAWIKSNKVAPKSIGVELLEGAKYIVMSLGYRDDESQAVKLYCDFISKIQLNSDYGKLEQSMINAAAKHGNIICHELFITDAHDLYMVFMTGA